MQVLKISLKNFPLLLGEWRNEVFLVDKEVKTTQLFGLASGVLAIPDKYREIKDEILEKKNQIYAKQ